MFANSRAKLAASPDRRSPVTYMRLCGAFSQGSVKLRSNLLHFRWQRSAADKVFASRQ
jgi:hypothetical protein